MRTLSVKLPEATKDRIDRLVASKGGSAHAFMVEAIESRLESEERHDAFVKDGLRAYESMIETGKAYDGEEVLAYMRAKIRGQKVPRPKLKSLRSFHKKPE